MKVLAYALVALLSTTILPIVVSAEDQSLEEIEKELQQLEDKERNTKYPTPSKSPGAGGQKAEELRSEENKAEVPPPVLDFSSEDSVSVPEEPEPGTSFYAAMLFSLVGGVWLLISLIRHRSFWRVTMQSIGMSIVALLIAWSMGGMNPLVYYLIGSIPVIKFALDNPEKGTIIPVALNVGGYLLAMSTVPL